MENKEFQDCLDDEYDFDEEYFLRTYQPLSNLPTPPPSSRDTLASQSPKSHLKDGELMKSGLLGPATHLVNLIPPTASLAAPSVSIVHEMLTMSKLPLDTIALAVCILDSLSSRFSLNWRLVCPLVRAEPVEGAVKRHTIPAAPIAQSQLNIDCVNPEVIVLAALMIASKFSEDFQEPTRSYKSAWGNNIWTCEQIHVTERCILVALGYRILPLWNAELIADAVEDMKRAAKQPARRPATPPKNEYKRSMSSSKDFVGLGLEAISMDTPTSEMAPFPLWQSLVEPL